MPTSLAVLRLRSLFAYHLLQDPSRGRIMEETQKRIETMEAAFVGHEDGNLFLQLAEAYRAAGDAPRALRVLRQGLDTHPAFIAAFALMGQMLFETGRNDEAVACLEQVLVLDPVNETARTLLAQIPSIAKPAPSEAPVAPAEANANGSAVSHDAMPWDTMAAAPVPSHDDAASTPPHGDPLRQTATATAPPAHPHATAQLEAGLSAGRSDSTTVALADLLVGLLEYRDPFFRGGTSLTRLLTAAVARELGHDEETVHGIALGAVLRDLGQLPMKGLIDKPGSELGADSRRKLERHVDTALELLDRVNLPAVACDTIRHHHERFDGTGYPDALAGDAIPVGGRIVAVADSFAAMIAARPHRLPKSVPAAIEAIRDGAGKQYDPAVVDALVRVLSGSNWRGLRFGLRHHMLVVDPDETRAMVVATKLCSYGYLAEAAFNGQTAAERLQKTRIVGLVISAELPGDEAGMLLREVRQTERLAMVPVIATEAGVRERIALLEAGADVCLGVGATFEELKATLEAFLRREGKPVLDAPGRAATPWAGLQGDIDDFPLAWLLQVLNYDSRTAAVFLVGDGDEGAIYLENGDPRHCATKSLLGEEAIRSMLRWKHGSFSVDPDATTEERTVKGSLMKMLMEQAVAEDHASFFGSVKV